MYPSAAAGQTSSSWPMQPQTQTAMRSDPSLPQQQRQAHDGALLPDATPPGGGSGGNMSGRLGLPVQAQQPQQQAPLHSQQTHLFRLSPSHPPLSLVPARRASKSPFLVAPIDAEAVSPNGSDIYAPSSAAVHAPLLALPAARFSSPYMSMHVQHTQEQQQQQRMRDAEEADAEYDGDGGSGGGGGAGEEEETLISSAAIDERSRRAPLSMELENGDCQLLLDGHSAFTPATPDDDKSTPPLRPQQHPYAYGSQSGLHHPGHSFYFSPLSGAVAHAASSISAAILPHSSSPHKLQHSGAMHSAQAIAEQHGASAARAIAVAASSQPIRAAHTAPWLGKRAPVDLAGARKKDDSLQVHYGHPSHSPHAIGALPLHMQSQSSGLAANQSLLNKLKAATQSVQVRVSRAMSVGAASPHVGAGNLMVVGGPMGGGIGGGSGGGGGGIGTGSTPSALDRLRQSSVRRWKEVPAGMREKMLFLLSSLLGTLFFFVLFEAFSRFFAYNLDAAEETVFTFAYVIAYLISIIYQHGLNRILIFRGAPYCQSLCHTFSVYSISLVLLTTLGGLLIRLLHANPRLIACFTLPASGLLNYHLLRYCLDGNLSMAPGDPAHSYAHPHHHAGLHAGAGATATHKLERGLLITEKGAAGAAGGASGSGGSSGGASSASSLEAGHGGLSHAHGGVNPLSALGSPSASPPTPGVGQVAGGGSGGAVPGSNLSASGVAQSSGSSSASASHLTVAQASPYGNRRYTISSGSKGGHYGGHYSVAHHPIVQL